MQTKGKSADAAVAAPAAAEGKRVGRPRKTPNVSFVVVDVLMSDQKQADALDVSRRKLAYIQKTDPDYPPLIGLGAKKAVLASDFNAYLLVLKARGYQPPPSVPERTRAKREREAVGEHTDAPDSGKSGATS